jgi:hypothetical protein
VSNLEEPTQDESNSLSSSSGRGSLSSENKWLVAGATAGFVFVVTYLVGTLIAPSAPNVNANVNVVVNYFNANVHSLLASGLLQTSAAFVFLIFLGTVYRVLVRTKGDGNIPASIVLISGTVFVAVAGLASIFTTTLAILAGQSVGNLSSAPYVPAAFLLRTVIGAGVFGLAAAVLLSALGVALVSAKLVGRWLGGVSLLLAACNAVGGGAALLLGSYNRFWMVVQTIGTFGIAFVILTSSVVLLVGALPVLAPLTVTDGRESRRVATRIGLSRQTLMNPRVATVALIGVIAVAAAIAVPLATRGSANDVTSNPTRVEASSPSSSASPTESSGSASVGYDGPAICAPTTDAATSGGTPDALMRTATEVASGTVEGKAWSLWSADGQSGAAGLEDGGVIFNGHEYGLCPGYPNPSESEMIDTGGDGVFYGVVNYPGLAQVQVSTGAINSFAAGGVLLSPHVTVVNGVSFYIGALPASACSYSYFEINTTSPSYSTQHNIGFGENGVGQGYSITNDPGNVGACVSGKLDPLSYSEGVWQLPPGQLTSSA